MTGEVRVDVKVDPEDIQRQLVQTILDTSVGAAIKRGIEKQVADLVGKGYNNPIEKAVADIVTAVVADEVKKHEPVIRKIVAESLTESQVQSVLKKFEEWASRRY